MISTRLRSVARNGLAVLALVTAVLTAPVAAEARSITIGSEAVLRELQDISLQGPKGEALYLGHKLTFHWLGLPYSLADDGYIIGVKGKTLYYNVSTEQITAWQSQNLLPSPLPGYQLGLVDYILGYLLWIALLLVSLWWLARPMLDRTKSKTAAETAPLARSQEAILRLIKAARSATSRSPRTPHEAPLANAATQPISHRDACKPVASAPGPLTRVPGPTGSSPENDPRIAPQHPPQLQDRSPHAANLPRFPVARTRCRVKALKLAS